MKKYGQRKSERKKAKDGEQDQEAEEGTLKEKK